MPLALLLFSWPAPAVAREHARPSVELDAPAPEPASTGASASDAELVRVLTTLFSPWSAPETRRRALADPALADPRAIPPLLFLLGDADPGVRVGAVQVLARFATHPEVEAALAATLARRFETGAVRQAAASSLAAAGTRTAADALYRVYQDETDEVSVREAARGALVARFPQILIARAPTEVVDRRGRLLLTLSSAALGSYALGTVGVLGQNDAGMAIGVLGGALVGAGSAFLLTRSGEITPAQAGWIASGGVWGAGLGMLTAAALQRDPGDRLVLSAGLIGELVGLTATIASRRAIPYTGADVFVIDLGGLAAMDLALGALLLSDGDNPRAGFAVLLGAGLAGIASSAGITRRLSFTGGDTALTLDGAYEGLVLGALAGGAFDLPGSSGAGPLLGLGLGLVGAAALSQATESSVSDVGFTFITGSYGKVLGLSVGQLAGGSEDQVLGAVLAGSAASLVAGYLLAPHTSFGAGDASLVAFGTALGFWHGAVIADTATSLDDERRSGLMWLGTAAGGLGTMALSQALDISATETLALTGGSFWGAWFAAWGAVLADVSDGAMLPLMLGASDVGLLASALLVSPLLDVDPRRIGLVNLAGLAGAGLASLGAALATSSDDAVITANLLGSAAGLVLGGVFAANLGFAPRAPADAPRGSARGGSWSRALSAARLGAPQLTPFMLAPDSRAGTGAAWGLGLAFVEAAGR